MSDGTRWDEATRGDGSDRLLGDKDREANPCLRCGAQPEYDPESDAFEVRHEADCYLIQAVGREHNIYADELDAWNGTVGK